MESCAISLASQRRPRASLPCQLAKGLAVNQILYKPPLDVIPIDTLAQPGLELGSLVPHPPFNALRIGRRNLAVSAEAAL